MVKKRVTDKILLFAMVVLALLFLFPILIVFMNSFKTKFSIMGSPFTFPKSDTFAGLENYAAGIKSAGIGAAFVRSFFITVLSVVVLTLLTAMTAWYLVRVKSGFTKTLYNIFIFSMIVPFQMVMYTMTYVVTKIRFNNPVGIIFVYLGFGAGLSVFMLSGFIKSIPLELEEAAEIDGCSPVQKFFQIVFPILKPTAITVTILNAMWIWNDYLLPYLILGTSNKTLPVAIQISMQGAYGSVNWGGFMAMLVLAILPIIIFYLFCQRYIIEGVIAGAVKG
ncbi:MAG: carbohydrate ABC transporter permease [Ruminococcus sp.]|nr:carbohydrate ABC transporter permease [Ruminococcus sp.]MCM1381225.1 carbohydrate ABC transporter permease [Muribaculaceae bacterium]MCM1478807.1 carbohydrate ABC transporter permease [Muribaculaceae bacterium]